MIPVEVLLFYVITNRFFFWSAELHSTERCVSGCNGALVNNWSILLREDFYSGTHVTGYLSDILMPLCLCLSPGITMTHNLLLNTTWERVNLSNSSRLQEKAFTHQNITYVDFYLHKSSVAAVFTIAYLMIFAVCMVGNGVVCFIVLRSKNMRTVTNLFILNLAISDLLVGIFCMPTTLVDNIITGQCLRLFILLRINFNVQIISAGCLS